MKERKVAGSLAFYNGPRRLRVILETCLGQSNELINR